MHMREIGSLCTMVYNEKDDNFICPSQAAAMIATEMHFFPENRKIKWK